MFVCFRDLIEFHVKRTTNSNQTNISLRMEWSLIRSQHVIFSVCYQTENNSRWRTRAHRHPHLITGLDNESFRLTIINSIHATQFSAFFFSLVCIAVKQPSSLIYLCYQFAITRANTSCTAVAPNRNKKKWNQRNLRCCDIRGVKKKRKMTMARSIKCQLNYKG